MFGEDSGSGTPLVVVADQEKYLSPETGRFGWVDLAVGFQDNEFINLVMERVKKRAGTETDVVTNMKKVGLDLFADLNEKEVGKGVRFRVSEKPIGKGQSAGGASDVKREVEVLAPEGVDKSRYLEWAINGKPDNIGEFVTAYHEATHTAAMPEVSGIKAGALRFIRQAGAGVAIVVSAIEGGREVLYQPDLLPWLGLATIAALAVGLEQTESEKKWNEHTRNSGALVQIYDEIGAYLSCEDVGLGFVAKEADLLDQLKKDKLYKKEWKGAQKHVGANVKNGLNRLGERVKKLMEADGKFAETIAIEALPQWDISRTSGMTVDQWNDVVDSAEGKGTKTVSRQGGEFVRKIKEESNVGNFLLEGGNRQTHNAAFKEGREAELDEFVFRAIDQHRAADSLGLTKYEFQVLVMGRLKGANRGKVSISQLLETADQVLWERAEQIGRTETPIQVLAEEGKNKAKTRHIDLRKIIIEELEKTWTEAKVDMDGKTLSWEKCATYFKKDTEGILWAIDIDADESRRTLRLLKFDKNMQPDQTGEKMVGTDKLDPIVEGAIAEMSDEMWDLLIEGLKEEWLPLDKPDDKDMSDGQLQIALLPRIVDKIPERWGMPELKNRPKWSEGVVDLWHRLRPQRKT